MAESTAKVDSKAVAQNAEQANSSVKKNRPEIAMPSLEQLLNAGAHFGHRKSRWNPKMAKFIYTERNGVHILDLVKTMQQLKDAVEAIQDAVDTKSVMIVGTKGQAAGFVQEMAVESGAYYVTQRWPGGLLTNFDTVKKSISRLIRLEEDLAAGAEKLVKKERLLLARDVERLNKMYEGVKFMDRLPGLVIVIDSKLEKNAIAEARNANIPIVALLDTNCDPEGISNPIPANDDSIKSIKLFIEVFGAALKSGRRSDALRALRNSHKAKLAQLTTDYSERVEREKAQMEEEIERLKSLRAGNTSVDAPAKSVRVVKATATGNESALQSAPSKEVKVVKAVVAEKVVVAPKAAAKKSVVKKAPAKKAVAKTEVKKAAAKPAVKAVKSTKSTKKATK